MVRCNAGQRWLETPRIERSCVGCRMGRSDSRGRKPQKSLVFDGKCLRTGAGAVFFAAPHGSPAVAPSPILDADRTRNSNLRGERTVDDPFVQLARGNRRHHRLGCLRWFGCAHTRGARNYGSVAVRRSRARSKCVEAAGGGGTFCSLARSAGRARRLEYAGQSRAEHAAARCRANVWARSIEYGQG
jgi:hypothetical protein